MRSFILFTIGFVFAPILHVAAQEKRFARYDNENDITVFTGSAKHPSGFFMLISNDALIKAGSDGVTLWKKHLSKDPLFVIKAISLDNDEFDIAAYDFNNKSIHFITVDHDGVVKRQTSSGDDAPYGELFFIGKDSVIVAGRRVDASGSETGFADLYDLTTGTRLWTYTSSLPQTTFTGAKRTRQGEIAVFGSQGTVPLASASLAILADDGTEKWARSFTRDTHTSVTDVAGDSHGNIKALVWRDNHSNILTLDQSGNLLAEAGMRHAVAKKITRVDDDAFLLAGTSRNRIFLTRLSDGNNFSWWRYYGSGAPSDHFEQVRGLSTDAMSIIFWGSTRWDSRQRAFLIQADNMGLIPQETPDNIIEPAARLTSTGAELKILSADFTVDGDPVVGGQLQLYPDDASLGVSSGFVARLNSNGDTLSTTTLLHRSSWGYSHNAVTTVKAGSADEVFIHETGGAYGMYIWSERMLSGGMQIFGGRRSDFTQMPDGRLLMCFHAFDLQPYNDVGRLTIIDPVRRIETMLPFSRIGSMIHKIIPSGKGTYYIAGEQIETYKVERKAFLAEVDANGTVLHANTYDLGYKTTVNTINVKPNGNIILAGASEAESGEKDLLIFEVDATGTLIWSKTYDILLKDEIQTLELVPGGYLVGAEVGRPVFGLQQSFGLVAFIGEDRTISYKKFLGSPGGYTHIIRLQLKDDSRVMVIGNSEKRTSASSSFDGNGFVHVLPLEYGVVAVSGQSIQQPQIYPNPFFEYVSVECEPGSIITFFNAQGLQIDQVRSSQPRTDIEVPYFPDGIYMIRIRTKEKTYTKKILRAPSTIR